ncbi:hypothetical protein [Tortoise microvirus 16]|nr:hypothetical protein [Tortoise microvirus 16]QCS37047.1 hypothetical protein [Tortoise microvirus 45]
MLKNRFRCTVFSNPISPCKFGLVDIPTNYPDVSDNHEWEPSETDPSYFVPTAEAVKTINTAPLSPSEIARFYDFKDGKDDGSPVPLSRKRGLDLADISEAKNRAEAALKKAVDDAKLESDIRKAYTDTSNLDVASTPSSSVSPT